MSDRKPKALIIYGLLLQGAEVTLGQETYGMGEDGELLVKRYRVTGNPADMTPEEIENCEVVWLVVDMTLAQFYAFCERATDAELILASAQIVLAKG